MSADQLHSEHVLFFDELVLADTRAFENVISETGHPCADDFLLSVPLRQNNEYQWYKNGIALINETGHELKRMYGEGMYQVRMIADGSCQLLKPYSYSIPIVRSSIQERICDTENFVFGPSILNESGVYIDTFKNQTNCDSIVSLHLELESPSFDTVRVKMFEGETFAIEQYRFQQSGEFEAALMSSIGCDSLVQLEIDYYKIFIPSAFSPNGDDVNDVFSIFAGEDLLSISDFKIYDRWGVEIYALNELNPEATWDGRFKGDNVQSGNYVYQVTLIMDDEIERSFSGIVAVLK